MHQDIDYITIETYKNFANGIKQIRLELPLGIRWVHTDKDYWTIVSKEFYNETKWPSSIDHEYMLDQWVACVIRDIDPHPYFEEFSISAKEMMDEIDLEHRIFAFIKDSSQLGGLLKFGKMETFRGPATYIQLLSHGVVNEPQYGIYNNPNARPTQVDTFGHGKWIEISPNKAYRVWADMYSWVLDKLVFNDRPCPLMLDCNQAFEIWKAQAGYFSIDSKKFDVDEFDKTMMRAMLAQITMFADQFFDNENVTKIKDEMINPDYENDYIDITE